jgi:hypothetical protein
MANMKTLNGRQLSDTVRRERGQVERYLFFFARGAAGNFVPSPRLKISPADLEVAAGDSGPVVDQLAALLANEAQLLAHLKGQRRPSKPRAQSTSAVLAAFRAAPDELLNHLAGLGASAAAAPALVDDVQAGLISRYRAVKGQLRHARKSQPGPQRGLSDLLAEIEAQRGRLLKQLARLSPTDLAAPGVVGEWSAKDVVAHLTAWEQMFLGWYQGGVRGETPAVPAAGYAWRDIDRLNNDIYHRHRRRSAGRILEEFDASSAQLVSVVRAIPEAELFVPGRYAWMGERGILWSYIRANSSNHYRWAAEAIRQWLKHQKAS